jgi:hypothetical protein
MTIKNIYRGVITMVITNSGIIDNLNAIGKLIELEDRLDKALLSASGEYAVNHNKKLLMDAYTIYTETLERVKDDREAIGKLLSEEVEIADFRKITENDFKDGITFKVMQALEFMTE